MDKYTYRGMKNLKNSNNILFLITGNKNNSAFVKQCFCCLDCKEHIGIYNITLLNKWDIVFFK